MVTETSTPAYSGLLGLGLLEGVVENLSELLLLTLRVVHLGVLLLHLGESDVHSSLEGLDRLFELGGGGSVAFGGLEGLDLSKDLALLETVAGGVLKLLLKGAEGVRLGGWVKCGWSVRGEIILGDRL